MKIHSAEIRGRVLSALERGESRQGVAGMFAVPLGTLDRWWREYRASGKVAPAPRGRERPLFEATALERLRAQLRQAPDKTAWQHAALWQEATGQSVSVSTLRRARLRLGWTHKKRACARSSATKPPANFGAR